MKKNLFCFLIVFCGLVLLSGCKNDKEKETFKVLSSQKEIKELITETVQKQEDPNNGELPKVAYASESRVIFYNQTGLFVFDMKKQKIIEALNLEDLKLYSTKGSYETQVLASSDGKKVQLLQRKKNKVVKDYCFMVDDGKIVKTEKKLNGIYQGAFYTDYKKDTFAGKKVKDIEEILIENGQGNSDVCVQSDNILMYLGYPSDVFIQPEEEFKNLQIISYDVTKNEFQSLPVFYDYIRLNQQKDSDELEASDDKVWLKRSKDGTLYFDVDALRGTKAASGRFGDFVVGNVFHSSTGKLTVIVDNPDSFDVTLKPVLSFNTVNDEDDPQIIAIKKNRKKYTFTGLKKGTYYYVDYYPTADPESEEQLKKIDDHNADIKVTIDNQ